MDSASHPETRGCGDHGSLSAQRRRGATPAAVSGCHSQSPVPEHWGWGAGMPASASSGPLLLHSYVAACGLQAVPARRYHAGLHSAQCHQCGWVSGSSLSAVPLCASPAFKGEQRDSIFVNALYLQDALPAPRLGESAARNRTVDRDAAAGKPLRYADGLVTEAHSHTWPARLLDPARTLLVSTPGTGGDPRFVVLRSSLAVR